MSINYDINGNQFISGILNVSGALNVNAGPANILLTGNEIINEAPVYNFGFVSNDAYGTSFVKVPIGHNTTTANSATIYTYTPSTNGSGLFKFQVLANALGANLGNTVSFDGQYCYNLSGSTMKVSNISNLTQIQLPNVANPISGVSIALSNTSTQVKFNVLGISGISIDWYATFNGTISN
jgi:hypothetical protein